MDTDGVDTDGVDSRDDATDGVKDRNALTITLMRFRACIVVNT